MVLFVQGQELPVDLVFSQDSTGYHLEILNGEERIKVHELSVTADSVHVRMPLFDAELLAAREGDSSLTGICWNHLRRSGEDRIPFKATAGEQARFEARNPTGTVNGRWEAHFSTGTEEAYPALGIFHQQGVKVTGTFGTETGDYRYLEGVLDGDTMRLSAFNGAQAYLFEAALRNDSLVGRFWSGAHWSEPWYALRNPSFHLRDPDSLTVLKEGHEMVDLKLPQLNGDPLSLKDDRFKGHPMVVQVMGSWCPNCVDETVLLQQLYDRYHSAGLEVVAVAFEKHREKQRAIAALERFRNTLRVEYPILYAGEASKENTSAQLPFLERMMSYPTCIFIDRGGRVRKIHTGFYGPGTGELYVAYRSALEQFIQTLLTEPVAMARGL